VIIPGQPGDSDLVRRIGLPPEHVDAMPKNGKPPLSPEEKAAVEWWIAVGAPQEGLVGALGPAPEVRVALAGVLGLPLADVAASLPP
jgi:hypothetical protein